MLNSLSPVYKIGYHRCQDKKQGNNDHSYYSAPFLISESNIKIKTQQRQGENKYE